MTAWFADSHYYLALLNRRDQDHALALEFSRKAPRLVTTQFVLIEVGDGLAAPTRRAQYARLLATLAARPEIEVVPASDELFRSAAALYGERRDKAWSMTDCTSFVVMREHGLDEALTGDHHFEQAGFAALLLRA